jgi:hypothetical protein
MNITDRIERPQGVFELIVRRRGIVIERWIDKNLVVDKSKLCLSRLLGGSVTGRSVTQIAFGTNGTAPAAGNTSITSPFIKALGSPTYPSESQVTFPFSLLASEANGMAIFEFGLLATDGTLFARKVRGAALNKDSDISVTGSWTIQF